MPMMIKQQQLENSPGTQCPLPFLIVRMSSLAHGCIFFLVAIGLIMSVPSYGRELINLLSGNQLSYIVCDINGSVCFRAIFKGAFLFCCYC